jgi:hypothetical protein
MNTFIDFISAHLKLLYAGRHQKRGTGMRSSWRGWYGICHNLIAWKTTEYKYNMLIYSLPIVYNKGVKPDLLFTFRTF